MDNKYPFDENNNEFKKEEGFKVTDDSFETDISSSSEADDSLDLFSYDNSNNNVDHNDELDLNNFSSLSNDSSEKKSGKKKGTVKQRVLKIILSVFLIGLITVSLVVAAFIFYAFTMVDYEMATDITNELNFTTTIYVSDGKGGYKEYDRLSGQYNRIWKDYDRAKIEKADPDYDGIPEMLANAFVAIEDKRFFEHDGIDWKRTAGAFVNEFLPIYSSRQGGSTITQQLVKNITDDRDQKASRKVREIMRARFLEGKYSKEEILECYLNTVPMGHGTYGVEVAANYYFGKTVNELSIAECASLASITKSPTYYAPDTNYENNKSRKEDVLYQMYDQGYITKKEYEAAKKEKLNITADERVLNQQSINSYFIDALITQVTSDLVKEYGYESSYASNLFYTKGLKVYATVNPDIQKAAESVFEDSETYAIPDSKGNLLTGSMTIMDYKGNVVAMVGGIGQKTTNRGWNNATDAVRQPGSTMKPLAAYAPALEKNLITYSSILNDTATTYRDWTPKNWYNTYLGGVTTQYALERSINTIPVALVDKMGVESCYDFVTKKLGITTLNPGTNGDKDLSPLGMGGTNGGLTTIESAAAFATFGNGGVYYEPILYTKVVNQDDEVILENKSSPKVAMSEDTASVMTQLLKTVVYGKRGTGTDISKYYNKTTLYAKTGTSNDQNDLWFVGGTPYYVGSVWCGYLEMSEIPKAHSKIALKMWGNVMQKVHEKLEYKDFTMSSYVEQRYYCTETGNLATSACPSKALGWYKKSYRPSACSTHSGELLGVYNPNAEKPKDDSSDSAGDTNSTENTENTETTE